MKAISVIGLGRLGASMAACIASKGIDVIGVDIKESLVEAVNSGKAPVYEPGLDTLYAVHSGRLRATVDIAEAVWESDMSLIIVPTPSSNSGEFSLMYVNDVCLAIGKALKDKKAYHNVVIRSTVMPGAIRKSVIPLLAEESGKIPGKDFGVCYYPEFVALGSCIRDFFHPDVSVIGALDARSGEQIEELIRETSESGAPIIRTTLENAELAKIALNCFLTIKISYANFLADLCENLSNCDIDTVSAILGADSRIGGKFLKGGLAYGGKCFPRDTQALSATSRLLGLEPAVLREVDATNRQRTERLAMRIDARIKKSSSVAVLGLAFKVGTDAVDESAALGLARALVANGHQVKAFDPIVKSLDAQDGAINVVQSLQECVAGADVVVIANPEPAFRAVNAFLERGAVIFDCWRFMPELNIDRYRYFALGSSAVLHYSSD